MKKAKRVGLRLSVVALSAVSFSTVQMSAQQTDSVAISSSSSKHLTSSSVHESQSTEIPRVWGALTGSYVPFQPVKTSSTTNSTTGEQISSTAANGQAGGGLSVNARLFGAYWISLGAVYRFAGYDTTDAVNSNTIYLERTRARFIDFPVLVRYTGPHFRWSKYSFYEAGGAVRYATHLQLAQAATDGNGDYYCCAPASTTGIRRTIEGAVVGTGVSGKDDFGIIVSPEVRYTRWFGNTFSSPTVATMRNQLEVTVSFGF